MKKLNLEICFIIIALVCVLTLSCTKKETSIVQDGDGIVVDTTKNQTLSNEITLNSKCYVGYIPESSNFFYPKRLFRAKFARSHFEENESHLGCIKGTPINDTTYFVENRYPRDMYREKYYPDSVLTQNPTETDGWKNELKENWKSFNSLQTAIKLCAHTQAQQGATDELLADLKQHCNISDKAEKLLINDPEKIRDIMKEYTLYRKNH